MTICTSPYLRLFAKELAKPDAGVFDHASFTRPTLKGICDMSHFMLGDEVALVAYKQKTIEEFVISVW